MLTFTRIAIGFPLSRAGSYFHVRSVSIAACVRRGNPEITLMSVTLPVESTNASTTATPSILPVRASAEADIGGDDTKFGGCRFPPVLRAGGVGPGTEMPSDPLPGNSSVCVPRRRGGSLTVDACGDLRTGVDSAAVGVSMRGAKYS